MSDDQTVRLTPIEFANGTLNGNVMAECEGWELFVEAARKKFPEHGPYVTLSALMSAFVRAVNAEKGN